MRFISIQFLLLSALLAASGSVAASQCVYRGKTADARVVRFSGEVLAPEGWTVDPQCERLEVVAGVVRVIAQGAGGKLVESEVGQGTLVKSQDGIGSGLLRQIAIVLAGDARARAGLSREGADFDALAEALPSGRVVAKGQALDIALPDPAGMRGAVLQLTPAAGPAIRIAVVGGALRIPADKLHSGTDYQWRLILGQTTLKGAFSVVSPAIYSEVRAAVDAELDGTDSNSPRELSVAARLAERGYLLESRALLSDYFRK